MSFISDFFQAIFNPGKAVREAQAGVMVQRRGGSFPLNVIYGELRSAPVVVWDGISKTILSGTPASQYDSYASTQPESNGDDHKYKDYLHRLEAFCVGPIESISGWEIDGDPLTKQNRFASESRPLFTAFNKHGNSSQSMFTRLSSGFSQIDGAMQGNDVAWSWTRFMYTYKKPAFNSDPATTAIVKGRRVWDPRVNPSDVSSKSWSDNPALILLDYLTSGFLTPTLYGRNLSLNDIDLPSFIATANECDELVILPTAPSATSSAPQINPLTGEAYIFEIGDSIPWYRAGQAQTLRKRFSCNVSLSPDADLKENVEEILATFKGSMPFLRGKFVLCMEGAGSSVMSFDDSTIIGGIEHEFEGLSKRFNRVTVRFKNAALGYKSDEVSWPGLSSSAYATYKADDFNQELHESVEIDGITDYYQAEDMAEFLVRDSRVTEKITFIAPPIASKLVPTDIVNVTHDALELITDQYIVRQCDELENLNVKIIAQRYDATVYPWSNGDAEPVPSYKSNSIYDDAPKLLSPTELSANTVALLSNDGSSITAIRVAWEFALDSLVNRYEVQWQRANENNDDGFMDDEPVSAGATYNSEETAGNQFEIKGTIPGQNYNIKVRSLNTNLDFKSDWVYLRSVAIGDTIAPGVPTNPSVIGTLKQITVAWTNPSDSDFRHAEIKRSATNVEADAVYLDRTDSGSYSDSGYSEQVTRYYWLRSVDRSGNASVWVSAGGGTSLALVANDFDAGVIDVAFLTSSLQGTISNKAEQSSLSVLIDEAQSTGDTLDTIAERMLGLATTQSDTLGLVSDAGITVDPATGAVTIQAVEALRTEVDSQINTVSVDLDAAEAEITLKASTAYVNNAIASAVLDSADLASLNELEIKVTQAEIDIDGAEAAILLKSDVITVSALDVRVDQAEIDIVGNTASINLKASSSDLTAIDSRVQSAEVSINALDIPSITQTVIDSRTLNTDLDLSAVTTLQDLIGAYQNREAIKTDLAFARGSISADVNALRLSTATSRTELGSLIDNNAALLVAESQTRASETAANASDLTSLTSTVSGKAESSALSALDSRVTTAEGEINSQASSLTTLESNIAATDSNVSGNATAISGIDTRVTSAEGTISSQATSISELSSTVGDNTTSISTQSTTINGITAQHSVTINSNGHVSGYGLVSDIIDGNATSAFVVAADQFAIGGANNVTGDYPFVHYANATTVIVDGETFTIPAGTYIDNAKINYLSANEIITGELSAARINVDGATIEADGDALKIKSLGVDTLQIAGNAVTIPRSTTSVSPFYLAGQVWTTLATLTFLPANVSGSAQPVSIKAFIPFEARDAEGAVGFGSIEYRIRRGSEIISGPLTFGELRTFDNYISVSGFVGQDFGSMSGSAPGFRGQLSGSVSPICLDVTYSTSQRTYTLQAKYTRDLGANNWRVPAGAVLECTEVKR